MNGRTAKKIRKKVFENKDFRQRKYTDTPMKKNTVS